MFREGNALLYEEPELGDAALYHAVLAAICAGAHKRSDIAGRSGVRTARSATRWRCSNESNWSARWMTRFAPDVRSTRSPSL